MSVTGLERISDVESPEPAERTTEDLRQEVEEKKEAIAETLSRLDQRVQRTIDWRAQVGDHPLLALGVAVSLGCLFSGIFKSKPSPRDRIMDAFADGVEEAVDKVRDRIDSHFSWPQRGGALKATAAAMATRAATEYLSKKLSGPPRARSY